MSKFKTKTEIFRFIGLLLLPDISLIIESYSRECPWKSELIKYYLNRSVTYNFYPNHRFSSWIMCHSKNNSVFVIDSIYPRNGRQVICEYKGRYEMTEEDENKWIYNKD